MSKRTTATKATPSKGGKTEVRQSPVHGKGVFAKRDLRKGEKLLEYKGELIDWEEALARHPHDPNQPNHTFYFHIDDGHVIDGGRSGNRARWINHACAPNCRAEQDGQQVFIFARKDIAAGSELFYDYGLILDEPYTPELLQDFACHCGSKKCRGTMLAPKDEPKQKKKKSKKD